MLRPFTLCPPRHETIYCRDVGWGHWFLLPFREGEEGGGLRPKGSAAAGAAGAPTGFALFDLVFPQIEPRSGPPMASAMLPGKVEKRMASSIFITLVPPRREVATKDKPHQERQPDGAEVPSSRHPQSPPPRPPALPNGGEGCTWRAGRMMMVLRMLWRYFAIGCVCRWGGMWGLWGGYSPNPCTPPRVDPAAGKGCVCSPLLISVICPLQPRRRLLLGQVDERWCKAVGVLLPQGFIGCYCPPKPTVFGFLPQKPTQRPPHPSSSSPKRPNPCPLRRWVRRCSNWTSRNPAPSR